MKKLIAPVMLAAALLLGGCVSTPGIYSGTVSTATYADPPSPALFVVLPPDPLSLTDRNIAALIEAKLLQLGYVKAESEGSANVAVMFNYGIGSGATTISSSPDYVMGGTNVSSSTSYPRQFRVWILDVEKTMAQEGPFITWQGEVFSSGSSANISNVAPVFVDVLMGNAGQDVTNKSFYKVR